jgi:pimeloyl-ACP methyl ester carboxylesterase
MKTLMKFLLLSLLTLCFQKANSQITSEHLVGSWLGVLNAGAVELRLVFNISVSEGDSLKATLDSPDQGATGVPLGEVVLRGDSVRIEGPLLAAFYIGKATSDSTILGEWHQAGRVFDLNLDRQETAFVLNRPQEPVPPYPYREEEVSFQNESQGFLLGGTLTIPEGEGPFPAVVLVTGSGSQNRDEEIFGHKPFKVIADHLTRRGIAVLRYDDRGVGSSGGSPAGSTSLDNAGDARSAFEYLLKRDEIEKSEIGIIGHSEGGMIVFMLASGYDDIAFIVSLAGPGVKGKNILLDQSDYINRLSGVEEAYLKDNRIVMGKVFDLMASTESYEKWAEEVTNFTGEYYSQEASGNYTTEEIEQARKNILGSVPGASYPWMRYFVMFDPGPLFAKITCPVLALNGEKDCQVMPEENIKAIKEGLLAAGNTHVTAMILPGLNHLFQNCETGLPNEYGTIEETFDPGALEIISEWILSQVE